jgi:two-component system sensor histidine kinase BaeS
MANRLPSSGLAARVALAFAVVATLAVASLALVIVLTTRSQTQTQTDQERRATLAQVTAQLARAYDRADGWAGADTTAAAALATRADAVLLAYDTGGQTVLDLRPAHPTGSGRGPGGRGRGPGGGGPATDRSDAAPRRISASVQVGGQNVGTAELRFPTAVSPAQSDLRAALTRATLLGSALALALAIVAAGVFAGTLTAPLRRLSAAVQRLRHGDRTARADIDDAPGELGDLARAFNAMAEQLQREDDLRRELVADLRHELRTPITILRGNLEELLDTGEPATAERLSSLHEEVLRLDALVGDLDAMITADTAALRLDLTPVDLAAVAATEAQALGGAFAAKAITVRSDLQETIVLGDRARLAQIATNLLTNALKYTPEGGAVTIHVAPEHTYGVLTIADSGPGLTEDERQRVFERFWRGTAAKGIAGRGIGLAIVASLARAHGGNVTVDSAPGHGARFTVTLPLAHDSPTPH